MRKNKIKLSVLLFGTFYISGCSDKTPSPFNKSFDFWEKTIKLDLEKNKLEKLKKDFIIFSNEYRESSLLPSISREIIEKLIEKREWEEVIYYIQNHIQKYITTKDEDLMYYYLIRTRYKLLKLPNRLQLKYIELLEAIKKFKEEYPYSIYHKQVIDIEKKIKISKAFFDRDISNLYKRIGKIKASKIYEKKYLETNINLDRYNKIKSPIYRYIFEGDGSSTWIKYLVPYGKNVVAENEND